MTRSKRKLLPLLFIILAVALSSISSAAKAEDSPQAGSMATYLLKQLNAREKDAYAEYEKAVTAGDIDKIKADLQSIVEGYDKLLSEAPEFVPALVSYAMMLQRIGEEDAAKAMFYRADVLDPTIPLVKNQIGNFMAEEAKYREALGFYILARDLEPSEPLYHYQTANILYSFRKFFIDDKLYTPEMIDLKIQEEFQIAAKLAPDNIDFRMRFGMSFYDVHNPNWELALVEWQNLRDYVGEDSFLKQVMIMNIARVRFEMGHKNAALKLTKKIDNPDLQEQVKKLEHMIKHEKPGTRNQFSGTQ